MNKGWTSGVFINKNDFYGLFSLMAMESVLIPPFLHWATI